MAVEFSTMMEIIGFCENLTRENETVSSRIDNNVVDEEIGYWSLLRGIIPGIISYIKLLQHNVGSVISGTLWCGVNDIAESYSSLGYNQQLDRSVSVQEKERYPCPTHVLSTISDVAGLTTSVLTRSNHSPASRGSSMPPPGPSKLKSTGHVDIRTPQWSHPFRSNCECEKLFSDCLHQVESVTADSLGRFYFNFLQLMCIDIRHPPRWLQALETEIKC